MKKKLIIISVLFVIGLFVFVLFRHDIREYFHMRNCIAWSENAEIRFKDFEGKSDPEDDYNIHGYHGIYIKGNGRSNPKAIAFFDKSKSWIIDTNGISGKELEVQKLRFDLHEYFARKMNIEIDKITSDSKADFKDIEVMSKLKYSELRSLESTIFENALTDTEIIKRFRPMMDSLLQTTN